MIGSEKPNDSKKIVTASLSAGTWAKPWWQVLSVVLAGVLYALFAHFLKRRYERRVATEGFVLDAQQLAAKHDRARTATRRGSYARSVEQRACARVAGAASQLRTRRQ